MTRKQALKELNKLIPDNPDYNSRNVAITMAIEAIEKQKTGKWKKNKMSAIDEGEGYYICSNCKADWYDVDEFLFCPCCGAEMKERA